jgi:RNA polymerase sigma factor for flagellar operon FliA
MEAEAQKQRTKDFLTNKLTRAEQLIIIFYYYNEMTMGEIAKALELPESKVSQMHSSIISRCKAFIHGKG